MSHKSTRTKNPRLSMTREIEIVNETAIETKIEIESESVIVRVELSTRKEKDAELW
jgi:hypothetical protein